MDRNLAKSGTDLTSRPARNHAGLEHIQLALGAIRCSGRAGTLTMRNPAVTGNILRQLVLSRLSLGTQLMTQEDPQSDQEGRADNRWRRQRGQVTQHSALLSAGSLISQWGGRWRHGAGVPAPRSCFRHRSQPQLYTLWRTANGRPAAPPRLRPAPGSRPRGAPGPAGRVPAPAAVCRPAPGGPAAPAVPRAQECREAARKGPRR